MLFSIALLLGPFVFLAVAVPTPTSVDAPQVKRRQGDKQILQTISPNYLVLLNQSNPYTVYGSQYTGTVSWTPNQSNECTTIVGWDVPLVFGATQCYLRFALPPETNAFAYDVQGAGVMDFYHTSRPVNPKTDSWNYRPTRLTKKGTVTVQGRPQGGEATLTGQYLDCATLPRRLDFEFVAARVGLTKNQVETFQNTPENYQGWFLEFAIGA